jgi:predicted kinase
VRAAPAGARRVVLVSGVPGAGKSTIARPLAAELGFALLGKDTIKEVLADALEIGALEIGALEISAGASRRLGAAAMELMWALAADMPAVVLDANFWVDDERLPGRVRALSARPVEVHCTCPAELAAQRYRDRSGRLHPIHAQGAGASLGPEAFARSGRPAGIGAVLTVDTAGPVDVPALAAAVRLLLP